METKTSSRSIFAQELDRAILVTYFLGGIVPLMALGAVMHMYVFPALARDNDMTRAMLGAMTGVSVLNLAAFFALRRLATNAVERMRSDNARLKGILSASKDLSTSLHVQAVAEVSAACARELTSAEVSLILMRPRPEKPLEIMVSSGDNSGQLYLDHEDLIAELVENSVANRTATLLSGSAIKG
ncbi:MAG: hypothetical protein ACI8W3_001618, partial [Myxococcota bacterium]